MADDVREADHEPGESDAPARAVPDDEVGAALLERFDGAVFARSHGQAVVFLAPAELAAAGAFLRDDQQFTMCVDVTAADHLKDGERWCPDGVTPERFEVIASFLSHPRNRRIRLICELAESDPTVPSLTGVYPGTNFPEREVYDMFGITFDGHPELTRILMPDDWQGFPLRKDDSPARVPVTFKGDPSPR